MNVYQNVLPVIEQIRKDFPAMMGSVMQAVGKNLIKTIKESMKKGSVYGSALPALTAQRRAILGGRSKSVGGKYSNGVIYRSTAEGITVGFIFQHRGLQQFLGGGLSKWSQYNNIQLAKKMGDKAPFLKVGEYKQTSRPIIDLIANNPQTIKNIEQSAYNRVKQKLAQIKHTQKAV